MNARRWGLGLLCLMGLALVLALSVSGLLASPQTTTPSQPIEAPARQASDHSEATVRPSAMITRSVYLPLIFGSGTCAIPGESYGDLWVTPPPTDRPAESHADLNLALRGYVATNAYKGLVDYSGGADPGAPQLPGLFADNRTPVFSAVYRVYDWDWNCNCRGPLLAYPEVTLAGLAVTPGETIHVPNSGYTVGGGYEVLVLYASSNRLTLKYTNNDNVVSGYTLHVENVCVEPRLLALYQAWNSDGRGRLPALRTGQAFGRARGSEIGVAIRDYGTFMDPRSRKDWWRVVTRHPH